MIGFIRNKPLPAHRYLILALAMALSLAACGGSKTETPADNGGSTADNTSAEPTQMTLTIASFPKI